MSAVEAIEIRIGMNAGERLRRMATSSDRQ